MTVNLIGPCMPTKTWACEIFSGYPHELTEPEQAGRRPPLLVGWKQRRFTQVLLPEHVVKELKETT